MVDAWHHNHSVWVIPWVFLKWRAWCLLQSHKNFNKIPTNNVHTYIIYLLTSCFACFWIFALGGDINFLFFSAQRMGFMGFYGIWGYPTCRFASGTCAKAQAIFFRWTSHPKKRPGDRVEDFHHHISFQTPRDNFCCKPWNFIWYVMLVSLYKYACIRHKMVSTQCEDLILVFATVR